MRLNKNETIVLDSVIENITTTVNHIVSKTSIGKRTVQNALKKLVENGKVEAVGQGKSREYQRVFNPNDSVKTLVVFNSGQNVGTLKYGNGEYSFKYNEKYNGSNLEGLNRDSTNYSVELFTFFENLIPEYHRRVKLLKDREEIADTLEELNNSHGALDFIRLQELHKYKPNYGKRKSWITVKEKILSSNKFPNLLNVKINIADEILDAIANTEHSNLSGYQTKIDIDLDLEKKTITESKEAGYLLKPRNKEKNNYFNNEDGLKKYYPFIAINEHLFMSFAKNELGFDVPYSAIVKAKDSDYHYVTKRYDRLEGLKYSQVDFAQVMGIKSENKYKSSAEELFEAIDKKLFNQEAKNEAIKFYFYSYLVKHADLHLKNIGAIEIGNKKFIMAPLYDLISVGIYNGKSNDLGLPMKNPYKKPRNWRMEDFYKLASIIGLSKIAFKKEARKITRIYLKKMPEYIEIMRTFEKKNPLEMQKTRLTSYVSFSDKLNNVFNEKIISLKKLGVIKELELIDEAGGLLSAQKNLKLT